MTTPTMTSIRHIALSVADLQSAEAYYRPLFDMRLIGREAQLDDGLWYTLPFDKNWEDAEAAGVRMGMVALRNGAFVLALFQSDACLGQLFAIGLTLSQETMAVVRARLHDDAQLLMDNARTLSFRDRYQITWQLAVLENEFSTAGHIANRWLDI